MTLKQKLLIYISMIVLVLIAYYPSFFVPFYSDDFVSIVNNPLLQQSSLLELWHLYELRFIAYLSFWTNVQVFEFNLFAFHSVNLSIHLINGLLIYSLTLVLTQFFHPEDKRNQYIAFFSALIWLIHPLNTQAVTYIVQRTASLVTLFYLLTLISYLKLRIGKKRWIWSFLFLTSVISGILTKQNFFTLFPFLFLLELFFFQDKFKQFITKGLLFFVLILILAYPLIKPYVIILDSLTRESIGVSRYDYFITQLIIIGHYIAKYFYPIHLQLDMHYELTKQFSYLHFFALTFHATSITLAIVLRKKIPLITFGIILYYSGHLIESTFIPITDLAFEHRTYLPNIGLTIALVALIFNVNTPTKKLELLVMMMIIATLTSLTFIRNTQWQNPYEFYTRELTLAPNSPRSISNFATSEANKGNWLKSEILYKKALNLNLQQSKITISDVTNLMHILIKQKKYGEAVKIGNMVVKQLTNNKDKSMIAATLSSVLIETNQCQQAITLAKAALQLLPSNVEAQKNIAFCAQYLKK